MITASNSSLVLLLAIDGTKEFRCPNGDAATPLNSVRRWVARKRPKRIGSRPATNTLAEGNDPWESGVTEVVEKAPDAALDAMNATLRRMHATPPTPHKPSVPQARPATKEAKTKERVEERGRKP
jgi:hypothetical protein